MSSKSKSVKPAKSVSALRKEVASLIKKKATEEAKCEVITNKITVEISKLPDEIEKGELKSMGLKKGDLYWSTSRGYNKEQVVLTNKQVFEKLTAPQRREFYYWIEQIYPGKVTDKNVNKILKSYPLSNPIFTMTFLLL